MRKKNKPNPKQKKSTGKSKKPQDKKQPMLTKKEQEFLKDIERHSGINKKRKLTKKHKQLLKDLEQYSGIKVGTPKLKQPGEVKRGRKKESKYVPVGNKAKLYARIKKLIWKKYKSDFKNYGELVRNRKDRQTGKTISYTSPAGKVFIQCSTFADCTDEEIIGIYESLRQKEKPPKPIIDERFKDALNNNYWELLEDTFYPEEWATYLYITSPMLIGSGLAFPINNMRDKIVAGQETERKPQLHQGEKYRFSKFVNYMNRLQRAKLNKYGYVAYGDPFWNAKDGRWEVEIFPAKADNTRFSYGFNPESDQQNLPDEALETMTETFDEEVSEGKEKKPVKGKKAGDEIEVEREKQKTIDKESELQEKKSEVLRQQNIKFILEMKMQGEITNKEMKELLAGVESKFSSTEGIKKLVPKNKTTKKTTKPKKKKGRKK